jgi:hypothetical protein
MRMNLTLLRGGPAARGRRSGHRAPGRGVHGCGRSRAPGGEEQGSCSRRGAGCSYGCPGTCGRGAAVAQACARGAAAGIP